LQLYGSTFGRRKRWGCKKIKDRKRRNTREAGSARKAKKWKRRGVKERSSKKRRGGNE